MRMGDVMDTILALYTKTDGRIGRKQWWLGTLGLVAVNLVISMLIFPLIGLGMPNMAQIAASADDPAATAALISGGMQAASWGNLILFLIFAYPIYALSVKRRHDKDNGGLDLLIYLGLTVLMLLIQALGFGYTTVDVGGVPTPVPTWITGVMGAVVGIMGIYMLVVLGFLKGTSGPNQYGPDPLTSEAPAAA